MQYEEIMQASVISAADLRGNQDERWKYLYHVPNGGDRDPRVGAKMKRQGVRRGVPDLCLPIARPAVNGFAAYHGLYLELKCRKQPLSEDQERWLQFLRDQGYCVGTIYDEPLEVLAAIEWYLDHE